MPRKRNPRPLLEGPNPQPQPSTSTRDRPSTINPRPLLEGPAGRRGRDQARKARRAGIREIRDLIADLDPVRDAPRLAAARHALERLETAEREDDGR